MQEREGVEEGLLDGNNGESAAEITFVVVLCTIVAASGSLAYGFSVGYSSPAEFGIMDDLSLSIAEYSAFGSILTFGGMIGALISGRIAETIGRRLTMWFLEIFFIVGWVLIIFAKNIWWLNIGRLLMGIGAGLHCYVAPIYIAEITPKNNRGGFTAAITFSVSIGFSLMFFFGNFFAWRNLALVGTIPSFIQVLGTFFIPESPRWLAKTGRWKEVEAALQRLRGKNSDVSSEAAEIKEHMETLQKLPQSRFLDLFNRRYAHSLIVGVGLMVLVQFGGTDAISSYTSSIFEAAGFSSGIASTVMAGLQLPAAAVSVALMDKIGRRLILMVTATGTCLGCLIAGLGFAFKGGYEELEQLSPALVLTGILVFSVCFSAGMGGTPWVIMSEIFPVNIKGTGGSLVTLSNWFSSWIVTYAFNFLFQWSSAGVFFVFACVSASIVIFVAKLVPETKGRTLEQIQASMTLLQ
ncbi:PREDICTED: sugar transporter ERD6-like 5 isoform X2 [Ipomoea nil]|uniref:sugar transporter ERD6-like 5 isoform X2 n=1 Tax=Ipomoea nil TaxID=35883 RepID=UPI000901E7B7|nr:PREDICTED: sugar transporter ERD6-like 5 isoform X2 [Ipomoea nil]